MLFLTSVIGGLNAGAITVVLTLCLNFYYQEKISEDEFFDKIKP